MSQFYVDRVDIRGIANHYSVTWDFEEFYRSEEKQIFEWPAPHALQMAEKEYQQSTIDYFSGSSFTPLNKTIELGGMVLTIINRPVSAENKVLDWMFLFRAAF
ncbi:hypothetical protein [Paenibacillus peoriae]|uniref:hypothetical protein n=1 Tax=Paenibacillus peoriae TaxID=59893 RepID=UPI001CC1D286|nr:hypothetical protein [Paenibacillus peoriae]